LAAQRVILRQKLYNKKKKRFGCVETKCAKPWCVKSNTNILTETDKSGEQKKHGNQRKTSQKTLTTQ